MPRGYLAHASRGCGFSGVTYRRDYLIFATPAFLKKTESMVWDFSDDEWCDMAGETAMSATDVRVVVNAHLSGVTSVERHAPFYD